MLAAQRPTNNNKKSKRRCHDFGKFFGARSSANTPCPGGACARVDTSLPFVPNKLKDHTKISANSTPCEDTTYLSYFKNYIPSDWYQVLEEAAVKGILFATLCTMTEEFVTKQLKSRKYTPQQIHRTRQAIRALGVFLATGSIAKALASPVINTFYTRYLKMKQKQANYFTLSTVMAIDLILNPTYLSRKAISFTGGMVGSLFGTFYGKTAYPYWETCLSDLKQKATNIISPKKSL